MLDVKEHKYAHIYTQSLNVEHQQPMRGLDEITLTNEKAHCVGHVRHAPPLIFGSH